MLPLRLAGLAFAALFAAAGALKYVPDVLPSFGGEDETYIVAINTDGKGGVPPKGEHRTEFITGADGIRYACSVPIRMENSTSGGENQDGFEGDSAKDEEMPNPWDHLEMLDTMCIFRQEGWWTYELCYGKHVRQFHQEDGRPDLEFLLGKFDEEMAPDNEVKVDTSSGNKNSRYISQHYNAGDFCDETQSHRSSEVRFYCEQRAYVSTTSIVSITEGPTCKYTVHVHTPAICRHPEFQIKDNTNIILCDPIDGKDEPQPILKDGSTQRDDLINEESKPPEIEFKEEL